VFCARIKIWILCGRSEILVIHQVGLSIRWSWMVVDAADSLIDVSEEVGNSVIWEAEEDDLDTGK
jgi:hypothetical protein